MSNRITSRLIAVLAAASFAGAAALPAYAIPDPAAVKPSQEAPKLKRYCVEQVTTGTVLKQARVCKTRDEWIAQTGSDPAKQH
ncbi:hypothetical protein AB2M62_11040 [Sphingomonas sp. MMS12-HWE2-04]|uniref:hypothetical protein n=1 Tax=Sphingomonas sp. MMS12-HWE2-04 TaxID=3234199 RepID=UPI00384E96C7